jgi:hypothetical protein
MIEYIKGLDIKSSATRDRGLMMNNQPSLFEDPKVDQHHKLQAMVEAHNARVERMAHQEPPLLSPANVLDTEELERQSIYYVRALLKTGLQYALTNPLTSKAFKRFLLETLQAECALKAGHKTLPSLVRHQILRLQNLKKRP